ncbi:DUF1015 domain-containing protein [Nitriliruptoraceae bacterium ZYF776]|nr:DUF1015 domain-containing protein [Profundirhabdus halotolerans]
MWPRSVPDSRVTRATAGPSSASGRAQPRVPDPAPTQPRPSPDRAATGRGRHASPTRSALLTLQPVRGHLVVQDRAHRVVAPPYDALDPHSRAAVAASDPDSYLGALPPGGEVTDPDAALRRCRGHLAGLLAAGRFAPLPGPSLLVLGLGAPPSRALAIVGDVEVAAFADGRVRPHERVRDDRVHDLARYLEVVGVASSPVAVTHRPHPAVTAATAEVVRHPPAVAYRAAGDPANPDGLDVAVWVVADADLQARLRDAIAAAGPAYVADGHHRAAAARRYAHATGAGRDDPAGRVLTAVLPSDHLAVRPFHRRLDGLGPGVDAEVVRDRLARAGFEITELPGPTARVAPGTVEVAFAGRWLAVPLPPDRGRDPVEALDVRRLERTILPVVVPEVDPATLVPVADPLAPDALVGDGRLGFRLAAPDVEAVLHVADVGGVVPAKTTYVVPKLRSGLLVSPRGPHAPAPTTYPGR